MISPLSLPREKTLTIKGIEYAVRLPKTGQFCDIETMKARLADGCYSMLLDSTLNAQYARLIIDMIATFTILIPKIKDDLNVPAIMELDLFEVAELVAPYKDEYLPWYNGLMEIITGVNKEEPVEEKK